MRDVEKRLSDRVAIDLPVKIGRTGGELVGRMINLSLGGSRVELDVPVPPTVGERVHVTFSIPNVPTPLQADAEVRWAAQGETLLVGLQFLTGFRAQETWALGRYLGKPPAEPHP